jgi:adenosylcobinamide-GDP ribazoletransferase
MRFLFVALQFLTIIPIRLKELPDSKDFSKAMVCFPVVGLLIGLVLAITNTVLSGILPHLVLNVILVFFLAVLTGGLHLDGLADTVDGIASRKNKEETLSIMRDSRIGTMGALSLIFVIVFKVALLEIIPSNLKIPVLIIMPCISRWSMLIPLYFFKYARESGKAKVFFDSMNKASLILATVIILVIVLFLLKFSGIFVIAILSVLTYLTARYMNKRIGGFTGDMLGAVNEINEVLFLLIILVIEGL